MPVLGDWLRPPRGVVAVFLAFAVTSAAAVGTLAWLLVRQDVALETQREQERLEHAGDTAVVRMQGILAGYQSRAADWSAPGAETPPGVTVVAITPRGIVARPSVPYYPVISRRQEAHASIFSAAERLEFSNRLAGAAARYRRLAQAPDDAVRAGALAREARVRRKLHDETGALHAYERLGALREDLAVGGIPAALVARVGKASVFAERGELALLSEEARGLRDDLRLGRWHLLEPEYRFYADLTREWLDAPGETDAEPLARARAVEWLWTNKDLIDGHRPTVLPSGSAVVAWVPDGERTLAIVVERTRVDSLVADTAPDGLSVALTDDQGRVVGGWGPPGRPSAVRTASAAGLPWTAHVFATPGQAPAATSPRRRLLILALVVLAAVLATGWYFMARAISRELRVSRLESDFVAAVSHEFRSPLTSVSHIAELLATDRLDEGTRRRAYGVLLRDAERLRSLVEGLLDFGRFDGASQTLSLAPIDIGDVVRATVREFQSRVAEAGYAIQMAAPVDATVVRADAGAVACALTNLLDNAVKYSPECQTVSVRVDARPTGVSIAVRDGGIGIPATEQGRVFQRFVRGTEATERGIRGTGIGLATVQSIVQAHGGEVHVVSEPGKGSCFTMVFPASEAQV